MALLNSENLKDLATCVEQLTHSGQKILDPTMLKKVKKICRLSDQYIDHAFRLITYQLDKDHAEIRFSAFQMCDELFRRSHRFRELLSNDMQHIMEMTAETSPDKPLPSPRSVAIDLKRLALRTIQDWNKEFGKGYKKLQIGFNFLKHCKKIDFNALHNESIAEQARIREMERRQNAVNQTKLTKATAEIDGMLPEINNAITSMQNCISLLLPTPEDFFIADFNNEENSDRHIISYEQPSTSEAGNSASTSKLEEVSNTEDLQNSDSDSNSEEFNAREYGMLNRRHTVTLNLDLNATKIKQTAENAPIFENARDLYIQLNNHYLPSVKKWIKIITKVSELAPEGQLKKVIKLQEMLESAINKCKQLKLHEATKYESADSSSDSEFEEVKEKDGYEENVKEDLPILQVNEQVLMTCNKSSGRSVWSLENNSSDPTTSLSTITSMLAAKSVVPSIKTLEKNCQPKQLKNLDDSYEEVSKPSTSKSCENNRKIKLLTVAPKLPFDVDLYHWEDEKVPIPTMLAVRAEGSQIWSARPSEGLDEIPIPDDMASSLRTRVIEYSGNFEPVKWACRAPLLNGTLCSRKDRHKCPFHGPVIPRDEMGRCSNPEDAIKLQHLAEEKQLETPDWQDPQLLEEIKAATGIDLKMPNKGRKKKKKLKTKYPGLTDLKSKQNTSHNRLAKKVFKKSVMKRISKTLDTQDHKRFRDKYGDQFHYMYNTA